MATDGHTLVRVDLKKSKVTATYELGGSVAQAAAFSSDGGKLALTRGHEIQIWDTRARVSLITLRAKRETQWSLAFIPDGNRVVSGGRGKVTLWDLADGKSIARFDLGPTSYVQTVAVSSDGSLLAAVPASAGQRVIVFRIPE